VEKWNKAVENFTLLCQVRGNEEWFGVRRKLLDNDGDTNEYNLAHLLSLTGESLKRRSIQGENGNSEDLVFGKGETSESIGKKLTFSLDGPSPDVALLSELKEYRVKVEAYEKSLSDKDGNAKKQCEHELALLETFAFLPVTEKQIEAYEPLGKSLKKLTGQKEAIKSEMERVKPKSMKRLRYYNLAAYQSTAAALEANNLRTSTLVIEQKKSEEKLKKKGLGEVERAKELSAINECSTQIHYLDQQYSELLSELTQWEATARDQFTEFFGKAEEMYPATGWKSRLHLVDDRRPELYHFGMARNLAKLGLISTADLQSDLFSPAIKKLFEIVANSISAGPEKELAAIKSTFEKGQEQLFHYTAQNPEEAAQLAIAVDRWSSVLEKSPSVMELIPFPAFDGLSAGKYASKMLEGAVADEQRMLSKETLALLYLMEIGANLAPYAEPVLQKSKDGEGMTSIGLLVPKNLQILLGLAQPLGLFTCKKFYQGHLVVDGSGAHFDDEDLQKKLSESTKDLPGVKTVVDTVEDLGKAKKQFFKVLKDQENAKTKIQSTELYGVALAAYGQTEEEFEKQIALAKEQYRRKAMLETWSDPEKLATHLSAVCKKAVAEEQYRREAMLETWSGPEKLSAHLSAVCKKALAEENSIPERRCLRHGVILRSYRLTFLRYARRLWRKTKVGHPI